MKEKIIEAMYEIWCDGDCEVEKYDPNYDKIFKLIQKYVDVDSNACHEIENEICGLVCEAERNAFMNGVYVCLELINGNMRR